MIWHKPYKLEDIVFLTRGNMMEHLAIELTELGDDFISGRMPVDHRTVQPMKFLHGGASVALAESLASVAAQLVVDNNRFNCVGMEINANHLKMVPDGYVYATAKPIHIGFRTHVWSIEIVNETKELVCISRITIAVIDKKGDHNNPALPEYKI
jgi:1,4-dihydroxy-2-naphthoyl-CoA hydrolase